MTLPPNHKDDDLLDEYGLADARSKSAPSSHRQRECRIDFGPFDLPSDGKPHNAINRLGTIFQPEEMLMAAWDPTKTTKESVVNGKTDDVFISSLIVDGKEQTPMIGAKPSDVHFHSKSFIWNSTNCSSLDIKLKVVNTGKVPLKCEAIIFGKYLI